MAIDNVLNTGGSVAGKANVDSGFNLNVNLPLSETLAGYATTQQEVDSGEITGSRTVRQAVTSIMTRASVGIDRVDFSYYFAASAQNTGVWRTATTTFTTGLSNGYLTMNNGAVTTANAATIYQTYKTFPLVGQQPLMLEFSEFRSVLMPVNSQAEIGFFSANLGSTPFTPTDGAYIRFNPTGVIGVLNFAGSETTVTLLAAANMVTNDNTTYRIIVNHYRVEFWGASATSSPRVLLGIIPVPSANGPPFASIALPAAIRLFFSGAAGLAVQLKIANVVVCEQDTNQEKDYAHIQTGQGLIASQGQDGGTLGTTALYSNSLAVGAGAAMTNTTAALGTGLGGQFTALPTLGAGVDGIVCSYQVPAGTTTQPPRVLMITGVRVQSIVSATITGGPIFYAYSLAFGHTSVSMATAEAIAAKAPRRIALGWETYGTAAAPVAGTLGSGISMQFLSPVPVNPGEFIAIVAKNIGTVSTVGTVTFLVTYDGYYE